MITSVFIHMFLSLIPKKRIQEYSSICISLFVIGRDVFQLEFVEMIIAICFCKLSFMYIFGYYAQISLNGVVGYDLIHYL